MAPIAPLALLAAAPLALIAQDVPTVHLPPPPTSTSPGPSLISFGKAEIRCGGETASPVLNVEPFEAVGWHAPGALSFLFRIDDEGRPLGITPIADHPHGEGVEDLAPALAASRFAPGTPRAMCTATFRPVATRIQSASPARLARYYAMPRRNSPHDRAVFDALKPAGSDCYDSPPAPRRLQYPDFKKIPQPQGTSSYVLLNHDIDASGRPVNVRVIASDGNAALDRASIRAVRQSRLAEGPRRGCIYHFNRRQDQALATVGYGDAAALKSGPSCKDEPDWNDKLRLGYPDNYRRRAIEGWAVIGYDVAPWGATGNVRVLASEPTADFGTAAKSIIARARKPASPTGLSGCVERVRFAMPPKSAAADVDTGF